MWSGGREIRQESSKGQICEGARDGRARRKESADRRKQQQKKDSPAAIIIVLNLVLDGSPSSSLAMDLLGSIMGSMTGPPKMSDKERERRKKEREAAEKAEEASRKASKLFREKTEEKINAFIKDVSTSTGPNKPWLLRRRSF